jgi:hypothetical protein
VPTQRGWSVGARQGADLTTGQEPLARGEEAAVHVHAAQAVRGAQVPVAVRAHGEGVHGEAGEAQTRHVAAVRGELRRAVLAQEPHRAVRLAADGQQGVADAGDPGHRAIHRAIDQAGRAGRGRRPDLVHGGQPEAAHIHGGELGGCQERPGAGVEHVEAQFAGHVDDVVRVHGHAAEVGALGAATRVAGSHAEHEAIGARDGHAGVGHRPAAAVGVDERRVQAVVGQAVRRGAPGDDVRPDLEETPGGRRHDALRTDREAADVAPVGHIVESGATAPGPLRGVGHERAGVRAVGHAIAVQVFRAGVPGAVGVRVGLIGVGRAGAVVPPIGGIVRVVVEIAGVADAITVAIEAEPVGHGGAGVHAVELSIAVRVRRPRVRTAGRFRRLVHAVAVGIGVAGVALQVAIAVELIGVGHGRAVVRLGGHAVAVGVAVAGVALAVHVAIGLVGVGCGRAVVRGVGDAVAVGVATRGHVGRVHVHGGVPEDRHVTRHHAARGHDGVDEAQIRLDRLTELVEVQRARAHQQAAQAQ